MKHAILALLALTSLSLGQLPTNTPSSTPTSQSEILLARGIKNTEDFRKYLAAVPLWSWKHAQTRSPEVVQFKTNGTVLHNKILMKYSIRGLGKIVIKHPDGKSGTLQFAPDFKSFSGIWDEVLPFRGEVLSLVPESTEVPVVK